MRSRKLTARGLNRPCPTSAMRARRLTKADQGLKRPFPDNRSLRPNRKPATKISAALLKPKTDFFIFPMPPRGGVLDAFNGSGTSDGHRSCPVPLVSILLFGGFGYAHL